MADARTARLAAARSLGPETRLLEFALPDGEPLGFVGGQYVIVNTGVPLPGGKVAKRAYSILSSDAEQQRFQIAVRRIGAGPGSNFMHTLEPGADLPFSGPWGKYQVGPDDTQAPGHTLVFATDTGLTAALGLVRGTRFRPLLAGARVVWFVASKDYFLPEAWVETAIPVGCRSFSIHTGLPVHAPERIADAREALRTALGPVLPDRVFLSGDGAVLYPLCHDLMESGLAEDRIRLECFFNNPQRRAP
jgi:ferredoxin-NADP reductase